MNTFDLLKNCKVSSITKLPLPTDTPGTPDSLFIKFNNDCNLSISNMFTFVNISKVGDFIGEKIENIYYSDTSVSFDFSNNKKIIVSLKTEDWNGPEAMQFDYKGTTYIWN